VTPNLLVCTDYKDYARVLVDGQYKTKKEGGSRQVGPPSFSKAIPPKTLGSLAAKQLDETCLTAWQ
jgi:hypothetical protein